MIPINSAKTIKFTGKNPRWIENYFAIQYILLWHWTVELMNILFCSSLRLNETSFEIWVSKFISGLTVFRSIFWWHYFKYNVIEISYRYHTSLSRALFDIIVQYIKGVNFVSKTLCYLPFALRLKYSK